MRLQTNPVTLLPATYLRCPRSWDKARVMQHVLSVGGPGAACRVDFVTDVSLDPAPAISADVTSVPAAAPAVTLVPLAPLLAATASPAYPIVPPASSACLPSPTSVSPVSSVSMGTRVAWVSVEQLSEYHRAEVMRSAVAGRVRNVAVWVTSAMSGGCTANRMGALYSQLFGEAVEDDILSDPDLRRMGAALSLIDLLRCLPGVEERTTSTRPSLFCVRGISTGGGGATPIWQLAWIRLQLSSALTRKVFDRLHAFRGLDLGGQFVTFFRKVC
jgi:hypothetical protein